MNNKVSAYDLSGNGRTVPGTGFRGVTSANGER